MVGSGSGSKPKLSPQTLGKRKAAPSSKDGKKFGHSTSSSRRSPKRDR